MLGVFVFYIGTKHERAVYNLNVYTYLYVCYVSRLNDFPLKRGGRGEQPSAL